MIVFRTQFEMDQKITTSTIFEICRKWITESPHSQISQELVKLTKLEHDFYIEKDDELFTMFYLQFPDFNILGIKYCLNNRGLNWQTNIVYRKSSDFDWFSIEIDCESETTIPVPVNPKKPYIFKLLLPIMQNAHDNILLLNGKPNNLREKDVDYCADLINGKVQIEFPIVYISLTRNSKTVINPSTLANFLFGLAHVFVEPSIEFSYELREKTCYKNAYLGSIGVYWPEGLGSIILRRQGEHDKFGDEIYHTIRKALLTKRLKYNCSWNSLLQYKNQEEKEKLNASNKKDLDEYIRTFDQDIKLLRNEIQELEVENRELKSQVYHLSNRRNEICEGSLIRKGKEYDLYDNEIYEFILSALTNEKIRSAESSRKMDVLESLIKANQSTGIIDVFKTNIKEAFRDYSSMTPDLKRILNSLGFSVDDSGKHIQIIFKDDDRYSFTVPKTASDHRSGLNLASDISKTLF